MRAKSIGLYMRADTQSRSLGQAGKHAYNRILAFSCTSAISSGNTLDTHFPILMSSHINLYSNAY